MYYNKLRARARASLRGKWLLAVGLFVVSLLVYGGPEVIVNPDEYTFGWKDVVLFGFSLLMLPLTIGMSWLWLDLARGREVGFQQLLEPYQTMFGKSILVSLLQGLFIALWSLLLLVPGIIKSFSYMFTHYILRDNPSLSPLQAITRSRRMMKGHKAEAAVLGLSFIGWILLGVLTLFIGFIWIAPYMSVTFAHFYEAVRDEYEERAIAG